MVNFIASRMYIELQQETIIFGPNSGIGDTEHFGETDMKKGEG
jgi:hypothetical protein